MTYRDINLNDYTNLIAEKNKAKKYFRDIKVGNQLFDEANLKMFSPITTKISDESERNVSQSREIQQAVQNLDNRLQRRIDQVEQLQQLPYYDQAEVPEISKERQPFTTINFEINLNDDDRKNLSDMGLPMPNNIQSADYAKIVLKQVTTKIRSFAQYTRKDNKLKTKEDKMIYEQWKETLKKYKEIVQTIADGAEYIVTGEGIVKLSGRRINKTKRRKLVKPMDRKGKPGRPKTNCKTVYYNNFEELFQNLDKYTSLKNAGHNDVNDLIIDILDELLQKKQITRNEYHEVFKKYFPEYIK